MKFTDLLTESVLTKDEINEITKQTFKKVFPKSSVYVSGASFGKDTVFITAYLAGKPEEAQNKIMHNDPLNFMLAIYLDTNTTEYSRQSVTHNPNSKYLAFSSTKIGLRKFKFKDAKDFAKKLELAFKKTHATVEKLYNAGEMTVHGDKPLDIKSKL